MRTRFFLIAIWIAAIATSVVGCLSYSRFRIDAYRGFPIDESCFESAPKSVHVGFASEQTIISRLQSARSKNGERLDQLKQLFQSVGCVPPFLSEEAVDESDLPNLVCTLEGKTEQVIIVGAHFDKVPKGDGVADNWSGASFLPTLYQSLKTRTRRHTFVFIGFTDEEVGLIGSSAYVEKMSTRAKQLVRAMINLDTLGWGSTSVEGARSDPELVCNLRLAAHWEYAELTWMDAHVVGASDGESFREAGIPAASVHSISRPEYASRLHSGNDVLGNIHREGLYQTYRVIAVFLALLDESPD